MKKFRIIFIVITFVLLAISIIYFSDNYNYYKPGENGAFKLRIGEEFSIKLYENPSTGYSNCWLNENSVTCIEKVDENYKSGLNSKLDYDGAGGDLKVTFKATKKGIDTLKIGSCPLGREGKTCKDYNAKNSQIDNEFYITVE
jgi:predicted secreted protein